MAGQTCYCAAARSFRSGVVFVLLVHPREARKRVGTARILRLCIENAEMVVGHAFELDQNEKIKNWVSQDAFDCFILYPGTQALNLESMKPGDSLFTPGKTPVIFVIDGTWQQARKMVRTSRILSSLRQLAFQPEKPSDYRIREQPQAYCVSSLEAVHALMDRLDRLGLCEAPADRAHDQLLKVFGLMVDRQIAFEQDRRLRQDSSSFAKNSSSVQGE